MKTRREDGDGALSPDAAAANVFLYDVIEMARERWGVQTVLAELLSERAGEEILRFTVNRWLHADPRKRKQPSLGMGILLREVFNANKKKISGPWNAAARRKPRGENKKTKRKDTNGRPTKDAANTQAGASISTS